MPCTVLFGLTISPVTYRLTYSKPSARRNKSRYGRSPFRTVSGTPTSGSIRLASSSSYSVLLFISFHALRLRNLPSRVATGKPQAESPAALLSLAEHFTRVGECLDELHAT